MPTQTKEKALEELFEKMSYDALMYYEKIPRQVPMSLEKMFLNEFANKIEGYKETLKPLLKTDH